jgi:hypothetical protein
LTSVPDHLPNRTRSPRFDVEGDEIAGLVARARADCDDFAFLRLLLGRVGDDDATLGFLFALEASEHNLVMKGTERHIVFLYTARARFE